MKDLPPILPAMLMNWAQSPAPIPNTSLRGVLFLYPQLLFLAQVTEIDEVKQEKNNDFDLKNKSSYHKKQKQMYVKKMTFVKEGESIVS